MKINIWTLYSKLLISPLPVIKTRIFGPYILKTPFVFTSPCIQNPNRVNRNWHKSLAHLDEGDREVDVGGVREPEGKGVQSSNGYHRFEVKVTSHGGWEFHDLENFDENWVFDFLELGFLIFWNWVF